MANNEVSKLTWVAIVVALAFTVYGVVKIKAPDVISGVFNNAHKLTSDNTSNQSDIPNLLDSKIKSGNISAWNATPESVLADVSAMKLNAVTVPVLVDIPNLHSNDATVNAASLESAKIMVDTLIKKGIKVTVEPYPYVDNGNSGETGLQPPDELTFMTNWSNAVKAVANAFSDKDIKGLYIGSNFENLEDQSQAFLSLISDLRKTFKGSILYRTNWWYTASWSEDSLKHFETKKNTPFFKELDILSVAAYFEVTKGSDDPNPQADIMDVNQLKAAFKNTSKWNRGQNLVGELESLENAVGKPIMFGELGIANYQYAMSRPYHYGYQATDVKNSAIQAIWYQAWIETMRDYSWFKGYSIYSIGDSTSEFYPNGDAQKTLSQLNT